MDTMLRLKRSVLGIFRDLHRHRMMTLERQALNPHLVTVPDDIVAIGGKDLALFTPIFACCTTTLSELGTHRAEYGLDITSAG